MTPNRRLVETHNNPDLNTIDIGAAIEVEALAKTYRIYRRPEFRLLQTLVPNIRPMYREHPALKSTSFRISAGETVGIIGQNGSGKSTLLQMIAGTLSPSQGQVRAHGRLSALLELGAGFNPHFSGHENIRLNASILGLSKEELKSCYDDIVRFSGLDADMLERPVSTYSSGMYVRLAFSVAAAVKPDILIVDEALAVGDEAFQSKCFARIRALQEAGAAVLFVSHSAQSIVQLCNRTILLDHGEVLMDGAPKLVVEQYHKLIYADPTRRAQIRSELLGKPQEVIAAPSVSSGGTSYDQRGAELSGVCLTDLDGNAIDVLKAGERYRCSYQVRFDKAAKGVKCGLMIKTKSGVELGGGSTAGMDDVIAEVREGDVLKAEFTFTCVMRDGTYFLNCGVSAIEPEGRVFLHRLVDAGMFTVLAGDNPKSGGMLDFSIESNAVVEEGQA